MLPREKVKAVEGPPEVEKEGITGETTAGVDSASSPRPYDLTPRAARRKRPRSRSALLNCTLNARDAGIAIQPTSSGSANLRLLVLPVESTNPADELKRIAERLGAGNRATPLDPSQPETLYQLERSLLDEHRIVPLVHLRQTFGIAPRVHFAPSVLKKHNYKMTDTAKALGLERSHLYKKCQQLGIEQRNAAG